MRMIKLSDVALVLPLKTISTNCLRCDLFPEIGKHANIVPVHTKNEKNLKGNYRSTSLLPLLEKYLKNSYTTHYTRILYHMNCLTQINQVFVQETQQSISLFVCLFSICFEWAGQDF